MNVLLFLFGLAVGSFLDVIATRYRPDTFLLSKKVIGGRSRCTKCGKTLEWFELIPILSFVLQAGRCRSCKTRLSTEYPFVELISGLIFLFVPHFLSLAPGLSIVELVLSSALWILVMLTLFLIALIDLRTQIIPDEANLFLGILGIALALVVSSRFGLVEGSSIGHYAALAGLRGNIWLNRAAAALIAGFFFFVLIYITKGRGMGGGDLKLAASLGLVFGWPDIGLVVGLAFVLGSVAGIFEIVLKGKTLKHLVPFGPFLSLSALLVFFCGERILDFYFALFRG